MDIQVFYYDDMIIDLLERMRDHPLGKKLRYNLIARKQDSFSMKIFEERSAVYIITSELFQHIDMDQAAFVRMLGKSRILMIFDNKHYFYEGNELLTNYTVMNIENEIGIIMWLQRIQTEYNKNSKHNRIMRKLLFKQQLYMLLHLGTNGTHTIMDNVRLLPGMEPYDKMRLMNAINRRIVNFSENYRYRFGITTIDDDIDFYSVMIVIFTMSDPDAMDKRLRENTLYALCVYIPQVVVMQLPRDPAIQHWANHISDMAIKAERISSEIVREMIDYLIDQIYMQIRSEYCDL